MAKNKNGNADLIKSSLRNSRSSKSKAPNRAADPKRVPKLGIGDPISHVTVLQDDPMRHVSIGDIEAAKERNAAYKAERE